MEVAFLVSGDEIYSSFFAWILLPISLTSVCISFALKPRRNDLAYRTILYSQYFFFGAGSRAINMYANGGEKTKIVKGSLMSLLTLPLLALSIYIRERIAKLPDKDLSYFLSIYVMKGAFIVGLSQVRARRVANRQSSGANQLIFCFLLALLLARRQLTFFAFSSVQCLSEASLENLESSECNRTLTSQTGLAGLVGLYTIIMLVAGMAPREYIERHTLKVRKLLTMQLNAEEVGNVK